MKTYIPIISLGIVLIITSCISHRYIDLQVLNPSSSEKLPSNSTLHIIDPEKIDSEHFLSIKDTVNNLYYFKLLTHTFDSTLKAGISASPAFKNSHIVIQTLNEFRKEIENKTSIEKNSHIIMSIPKMTVNETIQVFYDNWNESYVATNNYIFKFKFELRNIGNENYYDTSLFSDTLLWTSNSYYEIHELLIRVLPTRHEAIYEIGRLTAKRYAEKISPFWKTEERMLYYSNNRYLRKGYKQYLANNLEGAIRSWKQLYDVGTPQLASIAAHNIGLMYEMLDDFKNSELWLNNSMNCKIHYQTKQYLNRIKERKVERKKLDEQIIQP